MFSYALLIVLSGLLYRIPRGGVPIGWPEIPSALGAVLWAAPTALGLWLISGSPWALITFSMLVLGEAPGWSKWWPNRSDGGSMLKLSLRGCLLLNPLMGPVYFWFHERKYRLWSLPGLSGWTEWSELVCGLITAFSYSLLTYGVVRWMT